MLKEAVKHNLLSQYKSTKKYRVSKRVIDVTLSSVGIVIFAPVLFVLCLIIFLSDFHSPVFKQKRIGLHGEKFYIYKLRTMIKGSEEVLKSNKNLFKKYVENNYKLEEHEDPRITKIGRILRKTSLDEIPQLFNVLKGDMSIVGWRPIVDEELKEYGENKDILFLAKPGMTGYWQTSGRSNVGYPERVGIELYYIKNRSITLDIKLIFKTVLKVIQKDGAY